MAMRMIDVANLVKVVAKAGWMDQLSKTRTAVDGIPPIRNESYKLGLAVGFHFAWEETRNPADERLFEVCLARTAELLLEEGAEHPVPEGSIELLLRAVREQGFSAHNAMTRSSILSVVPAGTRDFYFGVAFALNYARENATDVVQQVVLAVHLAVVAELITPASE
jgi:hypothetical protein